MGKDDFLMEYPRSKIFELLYFPLFLILFFIVYFKFKDIELIKNNLNALLFVAIGLLNILASNILAYMFNISNMAVMSPLRFKPWVLKLFGVVFILNAIRVYLE